MAQDKEKAKKYKTVRRAEVPRARNGKHHELMDSILANLNELSDGSALKIPLAELPYSKEKVRSALNRAARKTMRSVATASDDQFLYVWNTGPKSS